MHDDPPLDLGFSWPDDVAALAPAEQKQRTVATSEMCILDDNRRFVRGVIAIPLEVVDRRAEAAAFGVWVEMDGANFQAYQGASLGDGAIVARLPGRLANEIKGFGDTSALEVQVIPQSGDTRPLIEPTDRSHKLAERQQTGVTMATWVELVHLNLPSWSAHELEARSKRYRFELEGPIRGHCERCGSESISLTRFVYFDSHAHAVYYAALTPSHIPRRVNLFVSLGEWGEGSTPRDRDAFALEWRKEGVCLEDAAVARWPDADIMGRGLNRDDALRHSRIGDVFELTDVIPDHDPVLGDFMRS